SEPVKGPQKDVPESKPESTLTRTKSHGPDVDFTDNDVDFAQPMPSQAQKPSADDGSDDDSDDGLFVVPIQNKAKAAPEAEASKPILTVDTRRSKKGLSVTIGSAQHRSASPEPMADGDDASSKGSRRTAATPSEGWESSEATKLSRRKSFVEKDVWANRPTTDALVNNLDDFFPNLDLDLPVFDETHDGRNQPPSPIRESEEAA